MADITLITFAQYAELGILTKMGIFVLIVISLCDLDPEMPDGEKNIVLNIHDIRDVISNE